MGEQCRNPGYDDRFTCPACYHDFEGHETTKCPGCGAAIHCYTVQEPVCICEFGVAETDED